MRNPWSCSMDICKIFQYMHTRRHIGALDASFLLLSSKLADLSALCLLMTIRCCFKWKSFLIKPLSLNNKKH